MRHILEIKNFGIYLKEYIDNRDQTIIKTIVVQDQTITGIKLYITTARDQTIIDIIVSEIKQ